MKPESRSVAVVGGGIMGLALALNLSQKGYRVTVFEKEEKVGGLASSWRINGFTPERFYHVILRSDSYLLNLLSRLGLKDEVIWVKAGTGLFSQGILYPLSDLRDFFSFPHLTLREKFRLGWTFFYASRRWPSERLERRKALEWLTALSGKKVVEKIWLPLLRSKLGQSCKEAGASYIQSVISRMAGARSQKISKECFGCVPGGYALILKRFSTLLRQRGVEIMCGTPVLNVRDTEHGVELESATGEKYSYHEAVLSVPSPEIAHLCPQLKASERKRLSETPYLGILCASLLLRKSLSPFYITNITHSGLPFTGVIEMTSVVPRGEFGGLSLVYLPRYLAPGDSFAEKDDREIKNEFFKALHFMYPQFTPHQVVCFKIAREKQAVPLFTPGYSKNFLPSPMTSLPHVWIANSSLVASSASNVNEILKLASMMVENESIIDRPSNIIP